MEIAYRRSLETCLASVLEHIEQIRRLDLSEATDRAQALEKTQHMMGALALHRERLKRMAGQDARARCAA